MTASERVRAHGALAAFPLKRLAALAVPLSLALILMLSVSHQSATYDAPRLLLALNMAFIGIIPLFIAHIAARSYLAGGSAALLLLGCGMMALAWIGATAGLLVNLGAANVGVTVYNIGALLAAMCHAVSAISCSVRGTTQRVARPRLRHVALAYTGMVMLMCAATLAAHFKMLPVFFDNGLAGGPTFVRQAVLSAAIILFAVSALLFWILHLRAGTNFLYWYSLALGLFAVGLFGVFFCARLNSLPCWAGRAAQWSGALVLLLAMLSAARDVRARHVPFGKAVAAMFGQAEAEYRPLVETATDGIVSLDRAGTVLFWNRAAERMFGVEAAQAFGRNLTELIAPPEQAGKMREDLAALPRTAEGLLEGSTLEITARRSEGTTFPAELNFLEREGALGRIAIAIIRDITARRDAEDALHRAYENMEARVRDRTVELKAMNETLELRVAERTAVAERRTLQLRALAAELSLTEQRERRRLAKLLHDHLQQLLVAARMQLAPLRKNAPTQSAAQTMGHVDEMLMESIKAARTLTVELSPPILYDGGLAPALEWLARQMQERHRLTVRVDTDPESEPDAEDVRLLLFEAARELLLNVVKHARVTSADVRLERAGADHVRLTVRDQGAGFEPERLDGAALSDSFGLFHIQQRLEMVGGQMELQTAPGHGTTAVLLAPSVYANRLAPRRVHTKAPAAIPAARARDERIRLLIADDHEILRQGLASLLRMELDMVVIGEAPDGLQAVELTHALRPDVVIMDLTMPHMNGIEATRRITAERPEVKVIGLSMHHEQDMADAMRAAGAVRYLTKGGATEELVATIRASMAGRRMGC